MDEGVSNDQRIQTWLCNFSQHQFETVEQTEKMNAGIGHYY